MLKILPMLALTLATITPACAQEDIAWADNPKVLACSPQVLTKGGTLTLTLGPRHGLEMAIRRTGTRDWYYVVTGGPEKQPLMTHKQFGDAKRVTLDENLRGYGPPRGELVKIFTRPGRFTVYISDKLESDAGGNICSVTYRP